MAVHPQLKNYRFGFRTLEENAAHLVEGVDDEVLLTSPDEGTWSVAQIFDHLNATGKPLLNALQDAIRAGQEKGPYGNPPFEYGIVSRWFIRAMRPSSTWSLPAPPVLQPAKSAQIDPFETLYIFRGLQNQFADCVSEAEGLDLRRIRVPSPSVPIFRVSMGAWFEATIAHEQRHLDQAREVLSAVSVTG